MRGRSRRIVHEFRPRLQPNGAPRGRVGMNSRILLFACSCLCLLLPCRARAGGLPDRIASGESGDRFGATLVGAGDVDGDRVPDLAIGAPRAGEAAGAVWVLSGRGGGLRRVARGAPGEWAGAALAAPGDLDGDGCADLAFGAPQAHHGAGAVRVVSGRDGKVLWKRAGDAPGDRFGFALAALGDVDGDGVCDLAAGAPDARGGGVLAGRVVVLSGRDGTVRFAWDGTQGDRLGLAVAGPGDLDGDGRGELLVGVPLADGPSFNAGAARVFAGGDGALLFEWRGGASGDRLGSRVAAVGDVDGDGVPDVGVGVPGDDGGGLDAGAVRVLSGADGTLLLERRGPRSGAYLELVAGVGDIDGDGRGDLALGLPGQGANEEGQVWIVSARSGTVLRVISGTSPRGWLGFALAAAGDLDGDGRLEVFAGAPGHDDDAQALGYVLRL